MADDLTSFETPNIILHGAPGTGKTYTIKKLLNIICAGDENRYYICQFHPSYTYQDFIEGIKPRSITSGNVNLEVVNGAFKQFCIKVKKENEKFVQGKSDEEKSFDKYPHYYFVVDEINRGNLSSIFGEILSLLEKDYRDMDFNEDGKNYKKSDTLLATPLSNVIANIEDEATKEKLSYKIVDDKPYFGIPFNIHFIGMMNDVDKSIDTFDLALRRRFKWLETRCEYGVIVAYLENEKGLNADDVEEYVGACKRLNDYITTEIGLGKNYEFGHSFFMKIKNDGGSGFITEKEKAEVFENYIEPTLTEYIRESVEANRISELIDEAKKKFGISHGKES